MEPAFLNSASGMTHEAGGSSPMVVGQPLEVNQGPEIMGHSCKSSPQMPVTLPAADEHADDDMEPDPIWASLNPGVKRYFDFDADEGNGSVDTQSPCHRSRGNSGSGTPQSTREASALSNLESPMKKHQREKIQEFLISPITSPISDNTNITNLSVTKGLEMLFQDEITPTASSVSK